MGRRGDIPKDRSRFREDPVNGRPAAISRGLIGMDDLLAGARAAIELRSLPSDREMRFDWLLWRRCGVKAAWLADPP